MKELNFVVDKEKCIKCGLCASDCITHVIGSDENGYPEVKNEDVCIGCQHCLAICPKGALSVFGKNPENTVDLTQMPNPVQVETLIKRRRSCRQYKQENVDKETIQKLKNVLKYVPTGVNYRGLHFTMVDDIDKMEALKDKLYKKLKFLLKFIPLNKKLNPYKKAILRGEDLVFRNAPHMVVVSVDKNAPCANVDPVIALSYFEMYAQSLGLGTLWCGIAYATLPFSKEVMKMLEIPKGYKLSYVMLFGYPKISYSREIQPDDYDVTVV